MKAHQGLTLVEVLVALVILGVVVAMLSVSTLSSVKQNVTAAGRTQAVQILSYLGRLASAGDEILLGGNPEWNYGELATSFRELKKEAGHADPALYRAEVLTLGETGIDEAVMLHYQVRVCWRAPDGESCVSGDTAGPAPALPGNLNEPLPIVN